MLILHSFTEEEDNKESQTTLGFRDPLLLNVVSYASRFYFPSAHPIPCPLFSFHMCLTEEDTDKVHSVETHTHKSPNTLARPVMKIICRNHKGYISFSKHWIRQGYTLLE